MPKPRGKKRSEPSLPPQAPRASLLSRVRFWALVFFFFSMPLFFSPWNTEYGYTKTIYTLVFVSLLLVVWAVGTLLRREVKVELSWLFPILPALLVAALLSISGKTPADVVLQSANLILYFGLIFLLVVNTELDDRKTALVLGGLLLAGFGNALFGLLQYAGLAPGAERDPMIATMGNRQFLAGFLSYLVIPAGILLVGLRRPWTWIPALVAGGFVLAIMLLTRQVAVRLGLAAGIGFVAFGVGFWNVRVRGWQRWVAAAGTVCAALIGVLGVAGLLYVAVLCVGLAALWSVGRLLRRFALLWVPAIGLVVAAIVLLLPVTTPVSAVRSLWERQSGAVRAWDLWVGYEMWRDRPLFGVGLGGYKIHFIPYKPAFLSSPRGEAYAFAFPRADQAHNEYVQVAAEMGTLGALVLLSSLGLVGYLGLRRVRAQRDPRKALELLLLGGGLIAFLVHAVPTFPFHLPASSLVFVAILGLAFSPRYGPAGDFSLRLRGRALRLTAAFICVFAVGVSIFAVRDMVADAYLLAGQVSLGMGDTQRARQQFARAVELDFAPRVSLYWLGVAHAQSGDLEAARDALRSSLDRYRPETLYIQLAQVSLMLGEEQEARDLLEELLSTIPPRPSEIEARLGLAAIHAMSGDLEGAERRLMEVIAVDRSNELAYFQLGEVARMRLDWSSARDHYERALAITESKERRIKDAYGTPVSLARLGQLRAEEQRLRDVRVQVESILRQIP